MNVFVSHSGGLDSTATLLRAMHDHPGTARIVAVGADYGQRHRVELDRAEAIRTRLGVQSVTVDLTARLDGSALLFAEEVPHGHYAEENMRSTVVQGRNLAFITAIVGMTQPGDEVWVGVHSGDHFIYPDCRPSFIDPLAVALAAAYDVRLVAPFLHSTKADIARTFWNHRDVATMTWSCYEGGDVHCGRCGTCVERREAFHLAELDDPTEYADPDFWVAAIAAHEAAQA